jgi:glucose-1-phosphate thymidylyltransferase
VTGDAAPVVAVILARGLGTRMRKTGPALDAANAAAAEAGLKALITIKRPFLDYIIAEVAEAGFTEVVLVIGPEHDQLRDYCRTTPTTRVRLSWAVQEQPLGTADAVRSVEQVVAGRRFLVINCDNHYPAQALRALRGVPQAGLVGYSRAGLIRGNLAADRVAAFAVVEPDGQGRLRRIVEKPDQAFFAAHGDWPVSMNCWLFTPTIFAACRSIPKSPRGEYELPDAVMASIAAGERYDVVPADLPVLDLSCRADIASVRERLADCDPVL